MMLTKDQIKIEMRKTQKYLDDLIAGNPHSDDLDDLKEAKRRLDELEIEIENHWPIDDTEKATAMGVYALKVLEDGPFGDLPEMMMTLAQEMGGGD